MDDRTTAAVLLTVPLKGQRLGDAKPLSAREWDRLLGWLDQKSAGPESLLRGSPQDSVSGIDDPRITPERIQRLLDRGAALGLAAEKWQRAGLWVLDSRASAYPSRLRKTLAGVAPPVLFGCGNRDLLDRPGVAIVGSRNAGPDELQAAEEIGGRVASQGYTVISGAARGVDQAGMHGGLDRDGDAVGIPSFGLLRDATSQAYRRYLVDDHLALVTPANPEAGFDAGMAMGRNKLIYCMATAAVVVVTDEGKGGTWAGATECLRLGWVPVWVVRTSPSPAGNQALVQLGARWLADEFSAEDLQEPGPPETDEQRQSDSAVVAVQSYEDFLGQVLSQLEGVDRSREELQASLGVEQRRLKEWLQRAEREGYVARLGRASYRRQAKRMLLGDESSAPS